MASSHIINASPSALNDRHRSRDSGTPQPPRGTKRAREPDYESATSTPNQRWTPKEDDILRESRQKGQGWAEISEHLPGRSADACRKRHTKATDDASTTGPVPTGGFTVINASGTERPPRLVQSSLRILADVADVADDGADRDGFLDEMSNADLREAIAVLVQPNALRRRLSRYHERIRELEQQREDIETQITQARDCYTRLKEEVEDADAQAAAVSEQVLAHGGFDLAVNNTVLESPTRSSRDQ